MILLPRLPERWGHVCTSPYLAAYVCMSWPPQTPDAWVKMAEAEGWLTPDWCVDSCFTEGGKAVALPTGRLSKKKVSTGSESARKPWPS